MNQPTPTKPDPAAAHSSTAKHTTALREATGLHLPHHVELCDDHVLDERELMVVQGLRALAAKGGLLPVRVQEPAPEVSRALAQAETEHIRPQRQRWASVEAAADGYVVREVQHGPNSPGYTSTNCPRRVPVPVRAADGTITVVAMPGLARQHEGQWIWAHTGWPIESPGQIMGPPQVFSPARELCWEVTVWIDLSDHGVLGEDYSGNTSGWQTVGWCTTRDDARLIARAYTAHRGPYTRADVLQHGPDRGVASLTRDTYLQAHHAPERTRPATPSGPRWAV